MKRGLACMLLCLCLTACIAEAPPQKPLQLLGDAAGLDENAALLRVDGREIPAWRFLYWLARACDTVCAEYRAAGMEPDWAAVVDGQSLADYVKACALSDTALYAVVENWAERYGCADTADAPAQMPAAAELGLDAARAAELDRVGQMYRRLYELFCTEGSVLSPSEETLAAFAAEQGWLAYERILIPFGTDRDAAREKAAELFARLNEAEDAAAEFALLAASGADPAGPYTLPPGTETEETILRDALAHLAVGQYSGILETAEGFSILMRRQPDSAALLEPAFDGLMQSTAEAAAVESTAECTALDVPSFYRALQRLREASDVPYEERTGERE